MDSSYTGCSGYRYQEINILNFRNDISSQNMALLKLLISKCRVAHVQASSDIAKGCCSVSDINICNIRSHLKQQNVCFLYVENILQAN